MDLNSPAVAIADAHDRLQMAGPPDLGAIGVLAIERNTEHLDGDPHPRVDPPAGAVVVKFVGMAADGTVSGVLHGVGQGPLGGGCATNKREHQERCGKPRDGRGLHLSARSSSMGRLVVRLVSSAAGRRHPNAWAMIWALGAAYSRRSPWKKATTS